MRSLQDNNLVFQKGRVANVTKRTHTRDRDGAELTFVNFSLRVENVRNEAGPGEPPRYVVTHGYWARCTAIDRVANAFFGRVQNGQRIIVVGHQRQEPDYVDNEQQKQRGGLSTYVDQFYLDPSDLESWTLKPRSGQAAGQGAENNGPEIPDDDIPY